VALSTYRETLSRPGLQSFMWTQFLGAFNDNLFKIIVSLLVIRMNTGATAGRDLSLVGVIFVLPFLLCSGYAGQLADIQSKRTVLIVTKSCEIVVAALACIALSTRRLDISYAALSLFALQATFFSPAKYGILPELLPARDLSRANGLLEMSTFVAIVAGTAAGSAMFDVWQRQTWAIGIVIVILAIIGSATSLGIPSVSALSRTPFRINPWAGIGEGLKILCRNGTLGLAVGGISYFWFLGALLQLVMVLFGAQVLQLDDRWVGVLTACSAVGIGAGSLAAGRLSRDTIEPGLVPIGAIGMGLFAIALGCTRSFAPAATALMLVGFFGGLFIVPLNALLQQQSDPREIGRVMATNNVLNMIAILLASGALWICTDYFILSPDRVVLTFGIITLAFTLGALRVKPELCGTRVAARLLGNAS
jgi:acyl-[acyl-carrier-protein]-phospholipid O-acyltransferase/long-chain-fatty-acid--[acyl-carrier-protein] ligase